MFNGGDTNLFGYVTNDPVNWMDPNGLWSISANFYSVIGGAVTFGRNPDGTFFNSLRIGLGYGAGVSWDKHGQSPAYNQCGRSGMATGYYGEIGAQFGPAEVGYGVSSGTGSMNGPYRNAGPAGSVNPKIGIGVGLSFGLEMSFY